MKIRQALWLFIMLIGLACSGWYFAGSPLKIKWNTDLLSTTTDMTFHHLTVRQFNTEGQLTQFLQTPQMRHVPFKDTYEFKKPHGFVIQNHQPAWNVDAESATVLYGGDEIILNGHVILQQNANQAIETSTIKTKSITYFPKKKQAITKEKISYDRPGLHVTSQGMIAYTDEKHVTLLNQIKGYYQPQNKEIILLHAGFADLNEQTHQGSYRDNIQLDQGTTHVRGQKAITQGDAQNRLIKAVIQGDKTSPAHYWTTTKPNTPITHAYADTMVYYPERHLIELIGHAQVSQGNDSFSAPDIRYDTKNQHVLSKNNTATPTAIIIHPRQHP